MEESKGSTCDPSCPICLKDYQVKGLPEEEDCIPCLSNTCKHNLCSVCLEDIIKTQGQFFRCSICRKSQTKSDYMVPNKENAQMFIEMLRKKASTPKEPRFDVTKVFEILLFARGRVFACQQEIKELFKDEINAINSKIGWKGVGLGLQTAGFVVGSFFASPILGFIINTAGAGIDIRASAKYSKGDQERLQKVQEILAERDRAFQELNLEMTLISTAEYVLNTKLDNRERKWWTKLVNGVAHLFDKVIPLQKIMSGVNGASVFLKAFVLDRYKWEWVNKIPTFAGVMRYCKSIPYVGTVAQAVDTALDALAKVGTWIEGGCLILQWVVFLFEWKAGKDRQKQLRELLSMMDRHEQKLLEHFNAEEKKEFVEKYCGPRK